MLTSTKERSIAEVQSLNLVLYNMSHRLKYDMMIMIIGSLIGKQYNRSSDDNKVSVESDS